MGAIDLAHAAGAQHADDLIRPQLSADQRRGGLGRSGAGEFHGRFFEKASCGAMVPKQRFDGAAERIVAGAGLREKRRALFR